MVTSQKKKSLLLWSSYVGLQPNYTPGSFTAEHLVTLSQPTCFNFQHIIVCFQMSGVCLGYIIHCSS